MSLLIGSLLVMCAQGMLQVLDLNSPSFFGYFVFGQKYIEIMRFSRGGHIDVVVVGHSHAEMGLDARRLEETTGLRTYNFAIPATDMYVQSLLIRDFVVPELKPRFILWHIPPRIRNRSRFNRKFISSAACTLQQLPHGHRFLGFAKDLFPYQNRLPEHWVLALVNPRLRRYDDRGFFPTVRRYGNAKAGIISPESEAWRRSIEPWDFPIPRRFRTKTPQSAQTKRAFPYSEEDVWRVTREAIESARRNEVQLYGFSASLHADAYRDGHVMSEQTDDDPIFENTVMLQNLIDEYRIPYVNYRYYAPISDDDRLFVNDSHLNCYGAAKLTDLIAHHLFRKDRPVSPDLRRTATPAELDMRKLISSSKHRNG